MPRNLVTGFKKIATSGPTVDGREIKEQDLIDIAETYHAENMYSAVIWPEHYRWMSLGLVKEVEAKKDPQGRMSLYARIAPNDFALEYNKQSQKLFTSIEITPNFAKTGKAYLTGLAMTDSPASLGTQELRFNTIKNDKSSYYSTPTALDNFDADTEEHVNPNNKIPHSECEDQAAKDGFFKALKDLFSNQSSLPPMTKVPESKQEDIDMTEEQFKQMMEAQKAQTDAITALATSFAKKEEDEAPAPSSKKDDETPETVSSDQFKTLSDSVSSLLESQKALSDQFSKLLEENPGTTTPQGDGANPDKAEELV